MALPRLQTSLCGCSVETGSKIVGWFNIIARSLLLIMLVGQAISLGELIGDPKLDSDGRAIYESALSVVIFAIVLVGLLSIPDILLLKGIYNKRPKLMYPWIVVQMILVIFQALSAFQGPLDQFPVRLGAVLIGVGISSYLILIVNSHYENLKSETYGINNDF
ncbi:hypothetical protein LSTR_LSTR003412 [Laodelphax striatellus]|uniref:DUF7027 domain-containing protein n=1 Tax=Laodelphax striatellus TaxID=195883 RepID=A0A482X3B5_LAOST|nr:hypothetical protein LSTR_LSTR003412 [Laodelphax striatellus]